MGATYKQDMTYTKVLLPVLLEGVHADLTVLGDVGVEDLREEETLWRSRGELGAKLELHTEGTALVGCVHCAASRGQ